MTARATRWSCSCLGEQAFAHRLVPSVCYGGLRCAPVRTSAFTRLRRQDGVVIPWGLPLVVLSAAKHLAATAPSAHRLVPLSCRRAGPFLLRGQEKVAKEKAAPRAAPLGRWPGGCVRHRPVPRRCIRAPARQGRDPSRPSCGLFDRRRTAARGEPELCGFSPPLRRGGRRRDQPAGRAQGMRSRAARQGWQSARPAGSREPAQRARPQGGVSLATFFQQKVARSAAAGRNKAVCRGRSRSPMPRCPDPSLCAGRQQKLARPVRAMKGAPRDE